MKTEGEAESVERERESEREIERTTRGPCSDV